MYGALQGESRRARYLVQVINQGSGQSAEGAGANLEAHILCMGGQGGVEDAKIRRHLRQALWVVL